MQEGLSVITCFPGLEEDFMCQQSISIMPNIVYLQIYKTFICQAFFCRAFLNCIDHLLVVNHQSPLHSHTSLCRDHNHHLDHDNLIVLFRYIYTLHFITEYIQQQQRKLQNCQQAIWQRANHNNDHTMLLWAHILASQTPIMHFTALYQNTKLVGVRIDV